MPEKHWREGDVAVLRYVDERRRAITHAWPCRVIADSNDLVVLYIPHGANYRLGRRLDGLSPMPLGDYRVEGATWSRDCLRLMLPGAWYSVWLLWDVEPRRLAYWYINMEAPFVRTGIGFDTDDYELDVIVNPDFTWRWKDEDHLRQVVDAGLVTPERAVAIRLEAESAIRAVTSRAAPFDRGWDRWSPGPSWPRPELPEDWHVLASTSTR